MNQSACNIRVVEVDYGCGRASGITPTNKQHLKSNELYRAQQSARQFQATSLFTLQLKQILLVFINPMSQIIEHLPGNNRIWHRVIHRFIYAKRFQITAYPEQTFTRKWTLGVLDRFIISVVFVCYFIFQSVNTLAKVSKQNTTIFVAYYFEDNSSINAMQEGKVGNNVNSKHRRHHQLTALVIFNA